MILNEKLALKNQAEKLQISENRWAWVLPEIDNCRRMIAYARNNEVVWIHPDYKNGQNSKKKK
jgi:plasmid rolling circle replication initiator protein Rep